MDAWVHCGTDTLAHTHTDVRQWNRVNRNDLTEHGGADGMSLAPEEMVGTSPVVQCQLKGHINEA